MRNDVIDILLPKKPRRPNKSLSEAGGTEVMEQNFAVLLGDISVVVLTDWPRVSGICKNFRLTMLGIKVKIMSLVEIVLRFRF